MKNNLRNNSVSRRLAGICALALCLSTTALNAQSFTQPLFIPDTLSTIDSTTITLDVQETQRVFFPGATTEVIPGHGIFAGDSMPVMTLSYTNPAVTNPGLLGPTLIWWKGDSIQMHVHNSLMEETTTHWHGAHVAPRNDGGPHQVIKPDSTFKAAFKIRDDVSTMWYHPHLHMMTMMQVNMGMAGMIIVKDSNDLVGSQLPHTYGVDEFPIILQDKYFGQDMMMMRDTIDTDCSMGTTFLVNGVWKPFLNVPAQLNRFRILNGSSERAYCVLLYDSTAMQYVNFNVIASDAGYLNAPYQMGTPPSSLNPGDLDSLLMIMSGERYEIVFDATGLQGHELYLINARNQMVGNTLIASFAGGPNLNDPNCYSKPYPIGMIPDSSFDSTALALMKIVVGPANGNPGILPSSLTTNVIPSSGIDTVRIKNLYGFNPAPNTPPFSIDGINYDGQVLNDIIYLNDIEEWNIYNVSGVAHPFHIHDIHFFITEINGQASNVPAYMQGPKDVAPVTDDSQFKLVMQFTDFATAIDTNYGYMYHCHILAHEDGGMMHQFVVTYPNNVGVSESLPSGSTWSVYPNPNNGAVTVNPGEGAGVLNLYDITGALVRTWNVSDNGGVMHLEFDGVSNGMYFLQLQRNGEQSTQKIQVIR